MRMRENEVNFNTIFEKMMCENDVKTVLVVSHQKADGDAWGSLLGLAYYIRVCYPQFRVIPYAEDLPENGIGRLISEDEVFGSTVLKIPKLEEEYMCIVVDTAKPDRIAGKNLYLKAKVSMVIDHHLLNDGYGDFSYVNYRESCAENIFWILNHELYKSRATNEELSLFASYIYMAMLTDSANFKRIGADTYRAANCLIEMGANHKRIEDAINEITISDLRARFKLINKVNLVDEGSIAYLYLGKSEIEKNNYTYSDIHAIADIIREAKGVEVAFSLFELEKNVWRCSMRSKHIGKINSHEILKEFGGGGHRGAASVQINTKEGEVFLANILDRIRLFQGD